MKTFNKNGIKFDCNDAGLVLISPPVFKDSRGYFLETYNALKWEFGKVDFVQDNESCSAKGTLRGLHYQYFVGNENHAQAKLVRVIKGSVIDFVLDIRKSSNTFGQLFAFELSEENKKQLFVPRGFAHGFVALEDNTIFSYKCDNFYCKESERGINSLDPDLGIDKSVLIPNNIINTIRSEKDIVFPNFNDQHDLFE